MDITIIQTQIYEVIISVFCQGILRGDQKKNAALAQQKSTL